MDKDDDYTRMGGGTNGEENVSYESENIIGESDEEFETIYYNEFEETSRAYPKFDTIKESKMGIKKVVFSKLGEVNKRYDAKLVLKEFVKEQHRPLIRLDLWSNRD